MPVFKQLLFFENGPDKNNRVTGFIVPFSAKGYLLFVSGLFIPVNGILNY
jgi:hypothetical protein